MPRRWQEMRDGPPAEDERKILVWHVFQGAMLTKAEAWRENRCYTHWQEVPEDGWIAAEERRPEPWDADEYNCVLALDAHDGPKITGWHQFRSRKELTHWQRTPEPPVPRPDWHTWT